MPVPPMLRYLQPGDALQPLYSVAQLRAVEAAAQAGLPSHCLMQRAGEAAAALALQLIAPVAAAAGPPRVLVAAGSGNNGGDALECAALLAEHGCAVTVLMPALPAAPVVPMNGQAALPSDHAQALARLLRVRNGVQCISGATQYDHLADMTWDLVIDGLFGIGLSRGLRTPWCAVITMMNAIAAPLLALDVPSGLDADTGAVHDDPDQAGQPGACIRASHTLTFIGDKPGLHTGSGREFAGEIHVAGLGIAAGDFPAPVAWRSGPAAFPEIFMPRRQDTHKGSHGDVVIIGGAHGMAGAAVLAAQAALKSGCGRVTIGFAQAHAALAFIPGQPELMCRLAHDARITGAVIVIGPGLGRDAAALSLVEHACDIDGPLVLDADALNLAAGTPELALRIARRTSPTLMTPHPLEAARLLGLSAAEVQADRLKAAAALAARFHAIVILKGSGTVIADGIRLLINPTGNAALATGGTGDVLAGMCGALLAQSWTPLAAAAGAVWLHGAAADLLIAQGTGPVGVTAGEIIEAARTVRNRLGARFKQPAPVGQR